MWEEFKKFINKGNMIDLAVALVIGVAFGAVIKSLVDDIIMPPIGKLLGGVDFANLFIPLGSGSFATVAAAKAAGVATINYGLFINTLINFLIVAFVVFLVIRAYNRMRKIAPEAPPTPTSECPYCLSAIPQGATRCSFCTSDLGAEIRAVLN